MLEVGCFASEDLYIYIKGFECPMSSKQKVEICLEPESNLVPSAREHGLPGFQYFYQVDVGGRGDIRGVRRPLGIACGNTVGPVPLESLHSGPIRAALSWDPLELNPDLS